MDLWEVSSQATKNVETAKKKVCFSSAQSKELKEVGIEFYGTLPVFFLHLLCLLRMISIMKKK